VNYLNSSEIKEIIMQEANLVMRACF